MLASREGEQNPAYSGHTVGPFVTVAQWLMHPPAKWEYGGSNPSRDLMHVTTDPSEVFRSLHVAVQDDEQDISFNVSDSPTDLDLRQHTVQFGEPDDELDRAIDALEQHATESECFTYVGGDYDTVLEVSNAGECVYYVVNSDTVGYRAVNANQNVGYCVTDSDAIIKTNELNESSLAT